MPRIARYQHAQDNQPESFDYSWEDLKDLLLTHERTPCDPCPGHHCREKNGPAWSPVEIEGTRSNKNVKAITFAVFDIDGTPQKRPLPPLPISLAELEPLARALEGVRYIAHSTHSHREPDSCTLRLVIALDRPATPEEWPAVSAAIVKRYGIPADPAAKDLARLYFLPSAPQSARVLAEEGEGLPLTVSDFSHSAFVPSQGLGGAASQDSRKGVGAVQEVSAEPAPVDLEKLRQAIKGHETGIKLLRGEALAGPGGRDAAFNAAAGTIAFLCPSETPPEALLEIFVESLQATDLEPEGFEHWEAEVLDMLERAQARKRDADEQKRNLLALARGRLQQESAKIVTQYVTGGERAEVQSIQQMEQAEAADSGGAIVFRSQPAALERSEVSAAFAAPTGGAGGGLPGTSDPSGLYSEEQISAWAEEQGCTVEEFDRRWIIQRETAYYVFVEGRYMQPLTKESIGNSLRRDLARAPVEFTVETANGPQALTPAAIVKAHVTVARANRGSLTTQRSFYDAASQTFVEALCPLRPLEPACFPEIAEWLRLFGGDQHESLLDWLACAHRLDRQMAALNLVGPPGTGKTLLATGLARLWTRGGPTPLDAAISGFNNSIVECPLLFADEQLPNTRGITGHLRRIIGSSSFQLRRKFLPECSVEGCPRLILSANNDEMFGAPANEEDASISDLAALTQRFIHIKTPDAAGKYLLALGGPAHLKSWVAGDGIARHALWLASTRTVDESARFLVQGQSEELMSGLVISGFKGAVVEWLCNYVGQKTAPAGEMAGLVLWGNGKLYVACKALATLERWEKYTFSQLKPSTMRIAKALTGMSNPEEKVRVSGANGSREVLHSINLDLLYSWVEKYKLGDVSALKEKINASSSDVPTF